MSAAPTGQSKQSSRFEAINDLWSVFSSDPARVLDRECKLKSSTLPSIAEDTILASLRERYLVSLPYTSISASALVSVNPHAYLSINGDASLQDYVAEYYRSAVDDGAARDGEGVVKETMGPHIFRTALAAYYNMRRTRQDQIMVMRYATIIVTAIYGEDTLLIPQWRDRIGQIGIEASGDQSDFGSERADSGQEGFQDRTTGCERSGWFSP